MTYGIGCQWNWPLKHCGALERVVPSLGLKRVVRVEGVDGVAGVVYEINKQCKPLLIQFALEDQLQVVQLFGFEI